MTTAAQELPLYLPVTPEQARRNRRVLDAALREHEQARKQARRDHASTETSIDEENR